MIGNPLRRRVNWSAESCNAWQVLDCQQRRLNVDRPPLGTELAGIERRRERGKRPIEVRSRADITAAVPSDSAKSRPSERIYVPPPQSTSKINSGYWYALTSMR